MAVLYRWFLLVFVVFDIVSPPASARAESVGLTPAEQVYLRQYDAVTLCVDPDWAPFESINERGEYVGIAADLLHLVFDRVGLKAELVRTANWDESLEASRTGRCQMLGFLNQTPSREEWLTFTAPIFSDSNVFITREEHPFIADPANLIHETIVFPSGTSLEERIRSDYPNLTVLTCDSEMEAMDMVSQRKADMTMRSLIVAAYTIKKEGLFNLKIAGKLPDYANLLRIGVTRGAPVLRDILNKGIRSITPQEREAIVNRHVSIQVQTGVDHVLIARIVAGFCLVLAVGLYWNYRLKKLYAELERRSQTDTLTQLANRTKINALLHQECDRSKRYGHPFSIILFDIDHFKAVNDELGHLMGDKVLVALARVAQASVRAADTVGRWGGEEFLVLCPETSAGEALLVATRLCGAIKGHAYESGRLHTVSAGVASFVSGDSVDALLQRADEALYQAKREGRDRVVSR